MWVAAGADERMTMDEWRKYRQRRRARYQAADRAAFYSGL